MPSFLPTYVQVALLLSTILLAFHAQGKSNPTFIDHFCSDFGAHGTFETNLHLLLFGSLHGDGGAFGFHNATVGEYPDKVYGILVCRGDVTSDVCQNCMDIASKRILQVCAGQKSAIIFYDDCVLRYSDRSFLSVMRETPSVCVRNTQAMLKTVRFQQKATEALGVLATQAALDGRVFATGEVKVSKYSKLYGSVQCTPDLSGSDCYRCLRGAILQIPSCVQGHKGGMIIRPSCFLRVQLYPYPRETKVAAPPSPGLHLKPKAASPPPLPPSGHNRRERKTFWIVIIVISSVVVNSVIALCVYLWTRRTDEGSETLSVLSNGHLQGPLLSLGVIQAATNNFSNENKLGQGGFGPVYKGILRDGQEIAVKKLSSTSTQGQEEFENEAKLIAKLQHRNLVKLLAYCIEGVEKLLIYEYMPNTSLDAFLFDPRGRAELDWKRRFGIIRGIARGLLYLHEESPLGVIIHRDLKASNVLLDHNMNAKISDFGMARIFSGNQGEATTEKIAGTCGYIAPEYFKEGTYSVKSDVFAFGVVVLEIISGLKSTGFTTKERCQSLPDYARKLQREGRSLELVDSLILSSESCVTAEVLKCIDIGLLCVEDAEGRPTMFDVVSMLGNNSTRLQPPTQPEFSESSMAFFSGNEEFSESREIFSGIEDNDGLFSDMEDNAFY